ncbi:MAG: PTS sugar transporter subunit IIA [Oscillospiraceae bacterium]|nr:PTS sugar transporter subunit IIA [Oscillospiraceae bacterium]
MLSRYLSPSRVRLDVAVGSLEEAVLFCGGLLVETGCASPDYPGAMMETVRYLGDGIVMAAHTALPHAAFARGGLQAAVAVIRLAQPIPFGGENGPVQLLFGFCGCDPDSHMAVLSALAEFLSRPDAVSSLLESRDKDSFYQLLCQS